MLCTDRYLRDLGLLLTQLHSLIGAHLIEVHLLHGPIVRFERGGRLLVIDELFDARQLGRGLLLALSALQLIDLLVQLLDGLERARAQLTMNVRPACIDLLLLTKEQVVVLSSRKLHKFCALMLLGYDNWTQRGEHVSLARLCLLTWRMRQLAAKLASD